MSNNIKNNWKPILFLFLIIPFLTELLSTNLSLNQFFQPITFLLLTIIGYGLPVLVIRELSVRWNLSALGIFILGLAYGIYNEGLLAKTLLLSANVPIPTFDHYAYLFGINFSWMATITVWHAFHATLFPILLTHHFFPNYSSKPWLSKKAVYFSFILPVIFVSFIFFQKGINGAVGAISQLIFFFVLILIFAFISRLFKQSSAKTKTGPLFWPVFLGFSFIPVFIVGSSALSGTRVQLLIYFIIISLILLFYIYKMFNPQNSNVKLLYIGLGMYLATAIFGLIASFANGRLSMVIIEILFVIIFVFILISARRRSGILKIENNG